MTETDKRLLKERLYASADMQADGIISAVEMLERNMPAGYTAEQKDALLKNLMEQSYKIVEESMRQYATQLRSQIGKVKEV